MTEKETVQLPTIAAMDFIPHFVVALELAPYFFCGWLRFARFIRAKKRRLSATFVVTKRKTIDIASIPKALAFAAFLPPADIFLYVIAEINVFVSAPFKKAPRKRDFLRSKKMKSMVFLCHKLTS